MSTGARAAPWRIVAWLGWGLAAGALLALGVLWRLERTQAWATPAIDPGRFVALRTAAGPAPAAGTWLVALNPGCPHCMKSLGTVIAEHRDDPARPIISVLLVDMPQRLDAQRVAALPGDAVWWDARGDWRRRWGHRVYGEIMHFDADGNYLGTEPPPPDPLP